ncbi:MAG: Thiamine diphosphokinase [Bacteroidota bacterium]|jgi:thiamine pyrophosphokinase
MSSHHIVREKQEPALIIADGEQCSMDLLEQLLEWSPSIMVLDGAIEKVLELGIKVDFWLGDFDSSKLDLKDYPLEKIFAPNQDLTDLEKGIEFLIERGWTGVNIVWATGKRMDHTLNNLHSIKKYAEQIKISLMDDYSVIYPLKNKFQKWYPKGTALSIIPFGFAKNVRSKGLKYELNHPLLELGLQTSSSNETVADGMVEIEYEDGFLWMMECHD